MNKVIAVYNTTAEAAEAVEALMNAGFNNDDISIYNREELTNNHIHIKMNHWLEMKEIGGGVLLGAVLGALNGAGVLPIPGFGFLYNTGIIKGALSGMVFGLLISVAIALVVAGITYVRVVAKNEKHLNEGRYLLFYDGHRRQDIKRAHEVLETPDLPIQLSTR